MSEVAIVVIGRNEGERLRRCLASVSGLAPIVYVDSGSSDGSLALARSFGVTVVELDAGQPYTAARARNAGVACALRQRPELAFIQLVDGDCELVDGWLEQALATMQAADIAVVCGRCCEIYPARSVYNTLCDIERDTPVGETAACGGDALVRVAAFRAVGGFDPSLIAGEEPEMGLRLRQQGWKVWRIDAAMTRHDAAMLHFGQWWRRAMRSGHAYAEVAWRHRREPEQFWVRQSVSIVFWGAVLPLVALLGALFSRGRSLWLLLGYPILCWRIYQRTRSRLGQQRAGLYALFIVLGKFAEAQGVAHFARRRVTGARPRIIEYKR